MNLEERNFSPTFGMRASWHFPLCQIMLWHLWHLLYNHNKMTNNKMRGMQPSCLSGVPGRGTGCIVYYRNRYLEVIPQCVQGKINRAYIGMHFAYVGDFHIKLRPCEAKVSIAPGEAGLSPPSTLAPPQIDQRQ